MEVIFFILGLVAGVISFCFGAMDLRETQRGVAGAACGFAVFAGLCFVAAAIVYVGQMSAKKDSQTDETGEPGDKG